MTLVAAPSDSVELQPRRPNTPRRAAHQPVTRKSTTGRQGTRRQATCHPATDCFAESITGRRVVDDPADDSTESREDSSESPSDRLSTRNPPTPSPTLSGSREATNPAAEGSTRDGDIVMANADQDITSASNISSDQITSDEVLENSEAGYLLNILGKAGTHNEYSGTRDPEDPGVTFSQTRTGSDNSLFISGEESDEGRASDVSLSTLPSLSAVDQAQPLPDIRATGSLPPNYADLSTAMANLFGTKTVFKLNHTQIHRAMSAGDGLLRDDLAEFLKGQLESWRKVSIWTQQNWELITRDLQPLDAVVQISRSVACIEERLEHDAIRLRMSQVLLFHWYRHLVTHFQESNIQRGHGLDGRGTKSYAIDHLLEHTYDDWHDVPADVKRKRRNAFHNQQRFGRRWLILASSLGFGVLIACADDTTKLMYSQGGPLLRLQADTCPSYLAKIIASVKRCFKQ